MKSVCVVAVYTVCIHSVYSLYTVCIQSVYTLYTVCIRSVYSLYVDAAAAIQIVCTVKTQTCFMGIITKLF